MYKKMNGLQECCETGLKPKKMQKISLIEQKFF